MHEILISDTSALIILSKLDLLSLLQKLYSKVYITSLVQHEFGLAIPNWIIVLDPKNEVYNKLLEINLDPGEASSIALALELENPILLIDERKGRRAALQLGLKITGTIAVLISGKNNGFLEQIKPELDRMKAFDFRISDSLYEKALLLAME